MFVSIYYKPSLFNAHTMILIVHIFMNVNKHCLNQTLAQLRTGLTKSGESGKEGKCAVVLKDKKE